MVTIQEAGAQLSSTDTHPEVILEYLKTGARIPFEYLMSLLMEERNGILQWMLAGARDFVARGLRLVPPPSVVAATEGYFEDEDIMGRFVKDWCEVVPIPEGLNVAAMVEFIQDPTHGSLSNVLHRAFTFWSNYGKYSWGAAKVTRRLEKIPGVVAVRGTGNRLYLNVVLKESAVTAVADAQEDIPF
jgi:hypothetical protein